MDKIIQSKKLTSYELEIEKFLEEKINTLTTSEYLFRPVSYTHLTLPTNTVV